MSAADREIFFNESIRILAGIQTLPLSFASISNCIPHHGFQVGSYHGQLVFFYFKQKIFQNGQYGIGINNTGNMLQLFQ